MAKGKKGGDPLALSLSAGTTPNGASGKLTMPEQKSARHTPGVGTGYDKSVSAGRISTGAAGKMPMNQHESAKSSPQKGAFDRSGEMTAKHQSKKSGK